MAVGFRCFDGVVIAADTQVTGANYTFPECKLINVEWTNGSAILAYSGNRDTFITFARELGSRLSHDANLTDQQIRSTLKDCLKASVEKKKPLLTITGYWIDGANSPSLIMTTTTQQIVEVAGCEIIGYGDSPLARFLLGRFRALPGLISVQQARLYAVDFISQAKQYDGEYVGGNINLYSIENHDCSQVWPSSTVSLIRRRDNMYTRMITTDTYEWERALGHINSVFDRFFLALITPDGQPSLNYLVESAKRFRLWATGKTMQSEPIPSASDGKPEPPSGDSL